MEVKIPTDLNNLVIRSMTWLHYFEDEGVLLFLMMDVVDDVCLRVDDVDRHCCRATKVVAQVE